jgi:hypothetical protein
MRREVALSMRDILVAQSVSALLQIAKGYQENDRWYLEALGTGCTGKEAEIFAAIRQEMGSNPLDEKHTMNLEKTGFFHRDSRVEP